MSHFIALSLENVFEEEDTTPRSSRAPSEARTSSPTPTLLPAFIPPQYEYEGQTYATLEEVITASAAKLHIDQTYVTWMKNVVDSVVMRHLT